MPSGWTVADVIAGLPRPPGDPLPAPPYRPIDGHRLGLCVESMRDHMTDEGWVLFKGLQLAGWKLMGAPYGASELDLHSTNVRPAYASTLLLQDKAEWDAGGRDFRDVSAKFIHVESLRGARGFRLLVRKDAHQRPDYNRESAIEADVHGWVVYYHPSIVAHLAPYVRQDHLVRTYHSIEPTSVQPFNAQRDGAVLSGALSVAYPLRVRIAGLGGITVLPHPGYHRDGCHTPAFLRTLSQFKVAICTASKYGYALRKMVEATACGCTVLTDLPDDEVLPGIDGNLVRIRPDADGKLIRGLIREMIANWNAERQEQLAHEALWYDWRAVGQRLSDDIEKLRGAYRGRDNS